MSPDCSLAPLLLRRHCCVTAVVMPVSRQLINRPQERVIFRSLLPTAAPVYSNCCAPSHHGPDRKKPEETSGFSAHFLHVTKRSNKNDVRHLPEKVARGVVMAHIPLATMRKPRALLDIVGCCCA